MQARGLGVSHCAQYKRKFSDGTGENRAVCRRDLVKKSPRYVTYLQTIHIPDH